MLVKCSLYRDLPWALKPPFWFYTDEVNNGMTLQVESDDGEVQQSTLYLAKVKTSIHPVEYQSAKQQRECHLK